MAYVWFILFVIALALAIHWFKRAEELEAQFRGQPLKSATTPLRKMNETQRSVFNDDYAIEATNDERSRRIASDPRWFDGETGDQAFFTYADSYGEVTDREVRNWTSSGPYINAFCLLRKSVRTFRKDRIEEWHEG